MTKGYTAISLSEQVRGRILSYIEKKYPKFPPSLSTFISQIALDYIEQDTLLSMYGPYLSYMSNNENTIFVKDEKNGRVAPVRVVMKENGQFDLFCELDQRNDCMHVGFVFALPEFYKILKEKGVKPRTLY